MDPFEKAAEAVAEIVADNAMRRRVDDANRTATEILSRLAPKADDASPCQTFEETQRAMVDDVARQLGVAPGSWRTPEFEARKQAALDAARKGNGDE